MARSMTGYGRGQVLQPDKEIIVELKSVNHRYFDFSCRAPRAFGFLEERLKRRVNSFVSRGKVDVFVNIRFTEAEGTEVILNQSLLEAYETVFSQLKEKSYLKDDLSILGVLKIPDMCTIRKVEQEEEVIWQGVEEALSLAEASFVSMREAEGLRLSHDILAKAENIIAMVEEIQGYIPQMEEEYSKRLQERMKQMLEGNVDQNRIVTEVATFSEKAAIDEEMVRLKSHFSQMQTMLLGSSCGVGRKLDFLIQEMNREVNTIGSKSNNLAITRLVVDMKSEIEKIREQIQNLE